MTRSDQLRAPPDRSGVTTASTRSNSDRGGDGSQVIVGDAKKSQVDHDFSRPAGRALWVAGLVYLLGSLLDFFVLWVLQNPGGSMQYEFVALTNTAEGFPRLIVAAALIYGGLHISGFEGTWAYRLLAGFLVALGLAALAMLAVLGLNYAGISSAVSPEGRSVFRASVIKTGLLSLMYATALLPLGILAFRTRKR